MCRTSHQDILVGMMWAWWRKRPQGWSLCFWLDNGWQVLSLTEMRNSERGSFGEAYNLVLDGVTSWSAFFRGFCSLPTSTFLPLPNLLTKISMYIYICMCICVQLCAYTYTHVYIHILWDIIPSGTVTIIYYNFDNLLHIDILVSVN